MRRAGPRAGNLWLALIGAGLLVAFAAIAGVQYRQVQLLATDVRWEGDNRVWGYFQLESEFLHFQRVLELAAAAPAAADAERLRLRFEILASRLPLVDPARSQSVLPVSAHALAVLPALQQFIADADPWLAEQSEQAITDAPLAALVQRMDALTPQMRGLILQVNQANAAHIAARNAAAEALTHQGIALTLFQSAMTLAFVGVAAWQLRALTQRRRRLEATSAALQSARERAEAASAAKTEFLATMSHELRTPVHVMNGMLTLLRSGRLAPEQAESLDTAQQASTHLQALLDDLLDVSRLDAGRLDLDPAPMSLAALVADLQAMFRPAAEARGLALRLELDPALTLWWVGDVRRVRQILMNLLGNALKFTERGEVALRVDRVDGALRLRVRDTGIGMDDTVCARLFQRFSQGESGIARRFGGTGLGLEISRRLARAMGGDITVHSRAGEGSEFTVHLPLQPCPAPAAERGQAPRTAPGQALGVLVVDDQAVNRLLLRKLLERMGHKVREAADGQAAIDAVGAQRPDLVFMDLHMPGVDGLAATRAIRTLPAPAGQVPVVAVTADAYTHTRDRLLAGGMDGFLGKPLNLSDLQSVLQAHGGNAEMVDAGAPAVARDAPATPATAAPPRKPRPRVRPGDLAELLDMAVVGDVCVGVGLDGYRPLLQGWLDDESTARQRLVDALRAGDGAVIKPLAHAVKGSAGSLGLKGVQAVARRLEADAATLSPDALAAAAEELDTLVQRSRAVCQRMGLAE
ncbi:MAG: response regulator [Burkholderiaceae bacterium]|nr:response regulator [Burkholderiaceae bacterium]